MKRHAPNIADAIADRITTHQVNLLRVDAGMRRRVLRLLRDVEADVIAQLMREDPSVIRRPSYRERRLIALAEQAQAIIRTGYAKVARNHGNELREVAEIEETFAREHINHVVRVDIMTVGVSEVTLREIARNTLIEGSPSRDWWAGQSKALTDRFTRQVRLGLAQGETIDQLVRRVRGTQAKDYRDGVMRASRRDAAALVRTSVAAVSNAARLETYQANDDVVEGVTQVSTLDGRTTPICIALSGGSWDFDGKPFPDSPYQGPNPAFPRHWGERSTLVARLKSLADMLGVTGVRKAAQLDRLPVSQRASMDGQVAATTTWETFLRGKEAKGPQFANGLLGRTRANLWRAGRLRLDQLIDQSGNPLSIDGLRSTVKAVSGRAIEEARAA